MPSLITRGSRTCAALVNVIAVNKIESKSVGIFRGINNMRWFDLTGQFQVIKIVA